jgi:hypothetical protein
VFQGFVEIEDSAFPVVDLVKNSSGVPINTDALPTYRVHGPDGLVTGQTGSASFRNSASLTNATNASPIVVTSNSHGLTTGTRVTITGVVGNTGANGTFVITVVNSDSFSLDSSAGGGAYVSGGVWNVTGLYKVSLDVLAANGYAQGEKYEVLVSGAISGAAYGSLHVFQVT